MKLFLTIFFLMVFCIFATDYLSELKSQGTKVDWSSMKIIAGREESVLPVVFEKSDTDFGKNNTSLSITESRSKARKKLKDRLLSEISLSVENLKIDSRNTIGDKIQSNEKFREKFNRIFQTEIGEYKVFIRGNKVVSEIAIPFTGKTGLINFLDINFGSEEFPQFPETQSPPQYTGLVIDARHLNSETSLFPRITTDAGLELYSPELVRKNYAIDKGYVLFQSDPIVAMKHARVGDNPYFVYALSATGEYKTDFSIPTEDVRKIFGSKKTIENLKNCNVIIVKNFPKK